ncbi:D-arabinitol 2-dehydrogenase [ribulose-forming] [Cytospora mali]|uniref:D-arabinitol 2-dehydrogenase [ribulose-forming] n=1 Tax=Cytospora mali TaxID=578113 RepID=A0A194VQR0_CYTMA|nr:D-arabinitol 2-dehydrogenase [ribulose-forming] [Valsa mali]
MSSSFQASPPNPVAVHRDENVGGRRLADFDLKGRVFVVTGGAQGLGLALAEGLVEAGGKVYCLDRSEKPDSDYNEALARVVPEWGGSLNYKQQDVTDTAGLDKTIASIADEHQRLDGAVAAAAVQKLCPAIELTAEDVDWMTRVNYTGVLMTASAAARQMLKYKCHGSICLIASMSGLVANKGLPSSVYNSQKAALIQLARNLAMEWGPIDKTTGAGGIRVNCISPGHTVTPMVLKHLEEMPGLREKWETANMMNRLAEPSDFKGAVLYLMSRASGFMTGNNMVIDGGHSAW